MSLHTIQKKIPVGTILITILGLICAFFLYFTIELIEHEKIDAQFQREVDELVLQFHSELQLAFSSLYGIRGLFNASDEVTREEFYVFAGPFLSYLPGVQALEWIPRVPHEKRLAYEVATRTEGFPNFTIREQQSQGKMVLAGQRNEYFPVHFMEPFVGNEIAFGFDIGSDPIRKTVLQDAWQRGLLRVTPRIILAQEKYNQNGFLAILPIFSIQESTSTGTRDELIGFALGVFRIGDIFNVAMQKNSGNSGLIKFTLFDRSSAEQNKLLHQHKSLSKDMSKIVYIKKMRDIGGRQWEIEAQATEAYVQQQHSNIPFRVLCVGVTITFLLVLYFYMQTKKVAKVNSLMLEKSRALAKQMSENQAIIDIAINSLIKIDEQGTIEIFNPAAEQMFGYRSDEVIGENIKILMPEPFRSAHDSYLANYLRTGNAKVIGKGRKTLGVHKNGTIFPLYLVLGESKINNQRSFFGFLLDINKQKQKSDLNYDFVPFMSYELRSALRLIKGSLLLILSGAVGELSEKMQEMLATGKLNLDRLTHLINAIDMEKLQEDYMNLKRDFLSVEKLVHQAMMINQDYANIFDVQLILTASMDKFKGVAVEGDEERLLQVFANLISNAIKFSSEKSLVKLTVVRVGEKVRFSVIDHGKGVAKQMHNQIFQQNYEGIKQFDLRQGSIGLGLAISKIIVEQHGGKIDFISKESKGSTFYFDLPCHDQ